jgi:flagellar motor component MotA
MNNDAANEIRQDILTTLNRYNYSKVKLYLVELMIANMKKVPSVRYMQNDLMMGRSSVNRHIMDLADEGWLVKVDTGKPRTSYYEIIQDRAVAIEYMKEYLKLCTDANRQKRIRKIMNHNILKQDQIREMGIVLKDVM